LEYKILTRPLSWFLLEIILLQETIDSIETGIASEIAEMEREQEGLRSVLDAEWATADGRDIAPELEAPSATETRYAELDEAKWARSRHATILRSALFLASYAAFEQCIDRLADEWREKLDLDLKPTDLRHRGIERSKAYLAKVVKMPFPSETEEWSRICHLRTVRNQLAHEGPRLTAVPESKLRAALEAFPGIYAEGSLQISLTGDFLSQACRTLQTFTNALADVHTSFSESGPKLVD
jgi:hypothetical protein